MARASNPYQDRPVQHVRWRPDHTALALVRFVPGTPAPQGSKRLLANRAMVESSKALPGWRSDVRNAFDTPAAGVDFSGPVYADLTFLLRRPKGEPRSKPTRAHLGKPDVDKLARAVLDALQSAGVVRDDSQVVDLHTRKRYCEVDEQPGCHVVIGPCALS